jgi:endonuclease-3
VNKVNKIFFEAMKDPHDGLELWILEIENYINTISFFRNKARFIYQTCGILIEKYNSEVPITLSELIALPWVGIKTAKVFLAVTQDAPYLWVDTHVHRVLNRTGIVNTTNANATDKKAEKILEKKDLALLHNTLIFFGRYYCTARKPKCSECKLNDFCKYYKKQKKSA